RRPHRAVDRAARPQRGGVTMATVSTPEAESALDMGGRQWWPRAVALARATPTGAGGMFIVGLFALIAVCAGLIMPFDPVKPFTDSVLAAPGAQFWLGTDGNGMDVLSRTIYGTRYAFGIAVPVLIFGMLFGIPVGLYAGYHGGWIDEISLRVMDA